MGIILAAAALLSLLLWIPLITVFTISFYKASDKLKFLRIALTSALIAIVFAITGTAASYALDSSAYFVSVIWYVALGPPAWLLLITYITFRILASKKQAYAYGLMACANGILLAIPVFALTFIYYANWIFKTLGVTFNMH